MLKLWIERRNVGFDLVHTARSLRSCFEALDRLAVADMTGSYVEDRNGRILFWDGSCINNPAIS